MNYNDPNFYAPNGDNQQQEDPYAGGGYQNNGYQQDPYASNNGYQQGQYQAPQYGYQQPPQYGYQQPPVNPYYGYGVPAQGVGKGEAIAALVLGICAIVLFWIPFLYLGFMAGAIVGIILGNKAKMKMRMAGLPTGFATAGFVCSIVGLVICVLNLFGGILLAM